MGTSHKKAPSLHEQSEFANLAFRTYIYMWQSQVEIEYYSVAYFERIAELVTLLCLVFAEGRAHTRFVDTSDIHSFTHRV